MKGEILLTPAQNKGGLLIEALIAIALSALLIPALLTGLFTSTQGKAQQNQRIAAIALMKEAEEAARSVREKGWSSIPVAGTYYPLVSSNSWSLASGSESINGFTRSIVISDVYRDASGVIASNGGTLDPSTKKIDVSVTWGLPYTSSADSVMYLTRYLQNTANNQTTQADFAAGIASGTAVLNTNGGEVTLSAGGGGDWCSPTNSITTVDLSRQGVPTAISAYTGNVVTGTGGNASGPTFVKIGVVGNNPPSATILGQFNNSKANGVFTEGNYGYIASTNNSEEIQILDLTQFTDPPTNSVYKKVGSFNAPGNTQGNSIFVSGTVGYMTAANKFYTFDLTSYTGSRAQLNPTAVTLAGTGNKVIVVGGYAFVTTSSTTSQLQIIDVRTPSSPELVSSINLGNNASGVDVSVNSTGTRAYVVTGYVSNTSPDFFIVDTTIKNSPSLVGVGFNTNLMSPKGVAIATGNRAIIVGTGGTTQYQVVNIANENAPTLCGEATVTNGVHAVSTVLQNDGYAYSYIVTGDANAELKIILGGSGGQFSSSGTFTSKIIDASTSAAFNYFLQTYTAPNQTSLQFQVAIASAVNGSCTNANFTYLGPDGTVNTYYTAPGAIPLLTNGSYVNPGRCARYKAFFTSNDSSVSPILYDATFNYSP